MRRSGSFKIDETGREYEVRHGRNYVRKGDLVRVGPSRSGKHDGFLAKFLYGGTDREGPFYALQALDSGGRPVAFRFIRPERVKRLAMTKQPHR